MLKINRQYIRDDFWGDFFRGGRSVASYVTDDEEESGQKASEDMAVEIKQHLLVNIN